MSRTKRPVTQLERIEGQWTKVGPNPQQAPKSSNPKDLLGIAKPSIVAVPASALFHLGRAMTEGRGKYGLYNWRETKVQSDIYFDAMMRHAWAWNDGEEQADGPLKCHHLAHVMACAAIILDGQHTGQLIDNRGAPGKLGELIRDWTEKKE